MKIIEVQDRNATLIAQLLTVWESAVRATHLFLAADEIAAIKQYVPQALREIPHLIVVEDAAQTPVGFMGITQQHLEMLFIARASEGQGLGKALLNFGMENYAVKELADNEQNPLARGFYEHMGFETYRRTAHDEQGNPYPLLYMKKG